MKMIFFKISKYAELKIFCICIDGYETYEGDDFNELYKVFSEFRNNEAESKNMLIEKY